MYKILHKAKLYNPKKELIYRYNKSKDCDTDNKVFIRIMMENTSKISASTTERTFVSTNPPIITDRQYIDTSRTTNVPESVIDTAPVVYAPKEQVDQNKIPIGGVQYLKDEPEPVDKSYPPPPINVELSPEDVDFRHGSSVNGVAVSDYTPICKPYTISLERTLRNNLGLIDPYCVDDDIRFYVVDHGCRYVESNIEDNYKFLNSFSDYDDDHKLSLKMQKTEVLTDMSDVAESSLLSSQPEPPQCDVELAKYAQFVIDPTTKQVYCIRQLHCCSAVNTEGYVPFSDLNCYPDGVFPLTHPISGRKFDPQIWKHDIPAIYSDPAICIARVKQELLGLRSPVAVDKSFQWRADTTRKAMVFPSTRRAAYLKSWLGQKLVVNPSTAQLYLLTPKKWCGFNWSWWSGNRVELGELYEPGGTTKYILYSDETVEDDNSNLMYHCAEIYSIHGKGSRSCVEPVDFDTYLAKEDNMCSEALVKKRKELFLSMQSLFLKKNKQREGQLTRNDKFVINPECQIVVERVSGKLYISQEVIQKTNDTLYTIEELNRSMEFSAEHLPSLRHEESSDSEYSASETFDSDRDDESYLVSVHSTQEDQFENLEREFETLSIEDEEAFISI